MNNSISENAFAFIIMFVVGIQGVLLGQEEKQFIDPPQLPCNEASWEGEDYYRAMGFGEGIDASESLFIARDQAIMDVLSRAFLEFYIAVEKSLGECVCIDTCRRSDGLYQTIVVYDVPKESLMLHTAEALVNAQSKINWFYREQYWKRRELGEREFRENAMKIFEKSEEDKRQMNDNGENN